MECDHPQYIGWYNLGVSLVSLFKVMVRRGTPSWIISWVGTVQNMIIYIHKSVQHIQKTIQNSIAVCQKIAKNDVHLCQKMARTISKVVPKTCQNHIGV